MRRTNRPTEINTMPAQSPALVKTKLLAQVGDRLTNVLRQVDAAKAILAEGVPANEQQGTPAISAAEVRAVVGEEVATAIEALG